MQDWVFHVQVSLKNSYHLRSTFYLNQNTQSAPWSRIRRVKCDEEKPSCLRCTSTGRKCDGYTSGNVRQPRASTVPETVSRTISTASRRLLPKLPGDDNERRHFMLFRGQTVPLLITYYDTKFWNQLILQLSQAEPAVHHSVVALASLRRGFMSSDGEYDTEYQVALDQYGLQQYNKAIADLHKQISIKGDKSIDVVLVCCILFTCFDMLRGDFGSAGKHLLGGLKIFSNMQQSRRTSTLLQDELEPMFVRLNLQSKSLFDTPHPSDDPTAGISSLPTRFSSLGEARNSLNSLMNQALNFVQAQAFKAENPQTQEHYEADLPLVEQASCIFLLEQWEAAFNKFLLLRTDMSSKDGNGVILLEIHHAASYVVLFSSPTFSQCIHDQFLPRFERIVSLTKSFMKHSNEAFSPGGGCRLWWVEMGIIPPLFLTAWKCRDPLLRREAAQLLTVPLQEGTWYSIAAGRLAERIIAIEEAGLSQITVAEDVPEFSRVYKLKVKSIGGHPQSSRSCTLDLYKDGSNLDNLAGGIEETILW